MSFRSWLGKLLKKDSRSIKPVSIYKLETPEKIIETKIQPVKVPTIVDVGERLAYIARDLSHLKNEMVTKSWFKSEFEDATPKIINLLNEINENLSILLSKFTKTSITQLGDEEHFVSFRGTSEQILEVIKKYKKIRYKNIKKFIPVSDPTLSKYLKILTENNKIRRIKMGKAVFYQTLN